MAVEDLLARLSSDPRVCLRNPRAIPELPPVDRRASTACVLYWMQRAQRATDNPALDVAVAAANALQVPLHVLFRVVDDFPGANLRSYRFMLEGLAETVAGIEERGARFVLRLPPDNDVAQFALSCGACLVVGDENPLRVPEGWRRELAERLEVPFLTVDADVIVPSTLFPNEEYAARTLRPKIGRELERFVEPEDDPVVAIRRQPAEEPRGDRLDPDRLLRRLKVDRSVGPVEGFASGTAAGMRALRHFLETHAAAYHDRNRRPEFRTATSRLSPYLHFGQIGPRSVASAVRRWDLPEDAREAWLEQFVVRRELAVNFVARNADYDRYVGFPEWARKTLEAHAGDPRPHRYTLEEFEAADTHDDLWNAAMREMTHAGFMHGYLRMYWAKKILHWTAGAEQALETAIHLNDRYFLDGRDPNGYTNIAWALGGRHDRPWPEREVFGKIRYMSHASTSRKFDAASYVQQIDELCGRNRP